MKLKKNIAKAIAVAMILGVSVSSNAFASVGTVWAAGEATAATLTVDYITYTASIAGNGNGYFFLEVLKDEKGEKVAATYCYKAENNAVENIDLSFLKATKEQYIRVYGDKNTTKSEVKVIAAQPGKLKVKYAPTYTTQGALDVWGSFDATEGKSDVTFSDATAGSYIYRPLYAQDFADFTEFDLETSMVAGTTIVLKKAATTTAPAGPEAKVKIAAIPKAPKVKVDYVKGTIKFPKNAEVIVGEAASYTALKETSYTLAELEKELNVTAGEAFSMVVRTAANGKKAASSMTFVNVAAALKAEKVMNENKVTVKIDDKTTATLTWEVTEKGVTFKADGADFQYTLDKKTKTIKTGKEVSLKLTGATEISFALAGVKADAKKDIEGRFASTATDPLTLKPLAKAPEAETDDDGKITISNGDVSMTITPSESANPTLGGDFTKFQYLSGDNWTPLAQNTSLGNAKTVEIRVGTSDDFEPSESIKITTPAQIVKPAE